MVSLHVTDYINLAFTALFLSNLIYVSLFIFTETNPNKKTKRKMQRNMVCKVCGYTMSVYLLLMVIHFFLPTEVESLFTL